MGELIKAVPKWVVMVCLAAFLIVFVEKTYVSGTGFMLFGQYFGPSKSSDFEKNLLHLTDQANSLSGRQDAAEAELVALTDKNDKLEIELDRLRTWARSEFSNVSPAKPNKASSDETRTHVVMAATSKKPKSFMRVMRRIKESHPDFYNEVVSTVYVCPGNRSGNWGLVIGDYTKKKSADQLARRAKNNGFTEQPYPLSRSEYHEQDIKIACELFRDWMIEQSQ